MSWTDLFLPGAPWRPQVAALRTALQKLNLGTRKFYTRELIDKIIEGEKINNATGRRIAKRLLDHFPECYHDDLNSETKRYGLIFYPKIWAVPPSDGNTYAAEKARVHE